MMDYTLQELPCFDAVATAGSFHAAADKLNRSHPAIFNAIRNLETNLDTTLLDRSGYRVKLTLNGQAFHRRAKEVLIEAARLQGFSEHLARGDETDLHVVIGDLCPTTKVVKLLKRFFDACPQTRLHLHFEALGGPWERLFDHDADLILHHVDLAEMRFETLDLFPVILVPVVAPGFLPFPMSDAITPRQLKSQVQCIIRDSAIKTSHDYHVIEGAHSWTVADQLTKKELILLGMGWGHLPLHLIENELEHGKLISIAGKHIKRVTRNIVAARLRDRPTGPIGERLWEFIGEKL